MATLKNDHGFSMVSMLAAVSLIFISLPFVAYLLSSLSYTSHYDALSVNHFFLFLRDELIEAEDIEIKPYSIDYEVENGEIATISHYKDLVRRQVGKRGHEVYLRDVEQIIFKTASYGIRVTIITSKGDRYAKTLFIH